MQIILKLTTACNLNCVYCSEGDKPAETLPAEIFYKLVDELPALTSDDVYDAWAELMKKFLTRMADDENSRAAGIS